MLAYDRGPGKKMRIVPDRRSSEGREARFAAPRGEGDLDAGRTKMTRMAGVGGQCRSVRERMA